MTFIASVVAKKGVAIIADSLVTSSTRVLFQSDLLSYIQSKGQDELTLEDVYGLFNEQPIFTKDYEEKLFSLDTFTGITTTGVAYIDNKSISDLVESFKSINKNLDEIQIEKKLELLSDFLNIQVREHLKKYNRLVGRCILIISHYEKDTHETEIYKLEISDASDTMLFDNANYNFVGIVKQENFIKIVCDGQNKLSDKVLFGLGKQIYEILPDIISDLAKKFGKEDEVTEEFINNLFQEEFYRRIFGRDIEIFNISELSLQQAVDLASLLMKLEVDFQKYTKNIPTVGGLIKLAVIDENGFRFISGNDVQPPKHLTI